MREAAKRELDAGGAARSRCIINVSSTSGTHGNAGQANYSTVRPEPHLVLPPVPRPLGMRLGSSSSRLVWPEDGEGVFLRAGALSSSREDQTPWLPMMLWAGEGGRD